MHFFLKRLGAIKSIEVFFKKRMPGRCEINQVFLKKEWLLAVKTTEVLLERRMTGRCKIN